MIFSVQPREFVDHITDDGQEYARKPYPFYVDEHGAVQRQDFWRGRVARVIGFVPDPDSTDIGPSWQEAVKDPASAVGKHLVTCDDAGQWSTHTHPISEFVEVTE